MNIEADKVKNAYLRLEHIHKYFGVTKALVDMNLEIVPGEVLGLVGPNGAGKSTLMKVITGAHEPTEGGIFSNDGKEPVSGFDTNMAKDMGIACAYQELSLLTNLKVYENFMITHMDHKPFAKPGWRKKAMFQTSEYLEEVFPNHNIDINTVVSDLSLAQRQMIEIAKAVSYKGLKVLILDEPTSSLTGDRIEQLHGSIRKLLNRNIAVIYISHKLDEIERICDRIVVMKSGSASWEGRSAGTSMHDLVEILGGKVERKTRAERETVELPVILDIKGLKTNTLNDVNMHVRKGEIIGISGLEGAGQKELISEIFKAAGRKLLPGNTKSIRLDTAASYVSGDRQNEGIFPLWNIADNTIISSLEQVTEKGIIRKQKFRDLAEHWYKKLKFRALGINDQITNLSGGNQQKALLARGLAADSDLILLNDPTCGVDIETKQEIYKLLEEARSQGKAIILHSTEDLEMEQCDRVYVMHDGKIARELIGDDISVQNIIKTSFQEKSKGRDADKTAASSQKKEGLLRKIIRNRSFLAFVTLFSIFIINSFLNPRILSYMGVQILYSSAVPLIFVALGQMFMVISGGIDLGNGMSLGLMNVIVAFLIVNTPGLGILMSILFIAAYAGLAVIIYYTKIPAIVITLGASFVWLGIALIISPIPGGAAPEWLKAFYNFEFPLIPMPVVIAIGAAILSYWIVKKSKYGMIINGIGNNPVAVERAGWSHLRAMVVTYALSGFMLVLGALMLTVISNSGDCNSTRSYNMLSIATIILGGCEFVGGIGSPVGVVAAALGISSISFLLTFLGIDSNLQSAVTGLILIVALALKLLSSRMEVKK